VPRFGVWLGGRPAKFTSGMILWKAIAPLVSPLTCSGRVARSSRPSSLRVEARFNTAPRAVYDLVRFEIAGRRVTVADDL
jgi:hypothetical protein